MALALAATAAPARCPSTASSKEAWPRSSFWNYALTPNQIANNYNAKLDAVAFGVTAMTGGPIVAAARPTNIAIGAAESNSLQVMQERQHRWRVLWR